MPSFQQVVRFTAIVTLLTMVATACQGPSTDDLTSTQPLQTPNAVRIDAAGAGVETPIPIAASTPSPAAIATATLSPTPAPASTAAATAVQPQVPTSTVAPASPLPASAHLAPMTHAFQTLNNCSAVSTAMVLSYYGISKTQQELGPVFRPNAGDKHVEAPQIVRFFPDYGLDARLFEGGSIDIVKRLIAARIPVITAQWLDFGDPIGHYRVVRGYDDARGGFLVNDSMNGSDVFYPYEEFEQLWRAFNYRYIPVYRPADEPKIMSLIGTDSDRQQNLERTLSLFRDLAEKNPINNYYQFSVGTNLYELGRFAEAVAAYERAAAIGLPPKMLWYQFWPVTAYNEVGKHQVALDLAARQLASAPVFGEMRYERGRAFEARGNSAAAIGEYLKALEDDANLIQAREAIARLGG